MAAILCRHCRHCFFRGPAESGTPGLYCNNPQTIYGSRGWRCPSKDWTCAEFEREPGADDD